MTERRLFRHFHAAFAVPLLAAALLAATPAEAQRARSTPIEPGGAGPSFSITPGPALEANKKPHVELAAITESDWARNEHAAARLISGVTMAGTAEAPAALALGLEFQLAKDWKLYWRTPGDAGYPPRIDWSGSSNVGAAEFAWPLPERYTIFGLNTFVYKDAVVLPLKVTPAVPGEPVSLRGKLEYLLCDKICIPYEGTLALDIPAGPSSPTDHAKAIESYAAKVPRLVDGASAAKAGGAGFIVEHAALQPESGGVMLEVLARSDGKFAKPDVIVEGPAALAFGAPQDISYSEGGRLALLRLPVNLLGQAGDKPGALPDDAALTLTLFDSGRAIEQDVSAPLADAHAPARLAAILALALLGGLLLNLMPCVLPVLSLKLMGAVRASGYATRELRLSFLATAAGIFVAFMALAGAAIALKAGGMAVGWGIQFQQPVFLAVMGLVLTLFACSLWGVFAIRLPSGMMDAANKACDSKALAGAFFTGVFATLLATPCSAPFLGTAVGFALTRGPGEILAVFAALALGLAAPYLLVAAVPRLARLLPKPGPWMVWFCRALALVLAATVFWLLVVLAKQAGTGTAIVCGLLLVAISAALTIGCAARENSFVRRAAWPAVGAVAIGLIALSLLAAPERGRVVISDIAWQPFDRVQIINAVATGKTVLVDVTADWCATCQVNKKLVLNRGDVRAAIDKGREDGSVIAMRADWTRPDPAITRYLAGFGRYGIPFNVVYGPAAPSGLVLSELLSEAEVLAAFKAAAGGGVASK
ncbi:MAG TPA: protein-disulfide reductase DsbD domain-containing protein [Alphaproteobacteria bacterium]|nr:protein-disulfide reductase DsbD domain-containing protein [Alphaproteobacteria bacterium]